VHGDIIAADLLDAAMAVRRDSTDGKAEIPKWAAIVKASGASLD
jgi:hypothetical protein